MTDHKKKRGPRPFSVLRQFLDSEASGGLILMASAVLALLAANSPLAEAYFGVLHAYVGGLSLLHWINDGLMAVFFLMVGLEIKREILDGQLSTWPRRILPGLAAAGGMAVPALIYVWFNIGGDPRLVNGWAIPSATDIAFALGVISLIGSRVPASLKVFLAALAILDDLGAVAIIAVFYTADLNMTALGLAGAALALLAVMNRMGVMRLLPYLVVGAVLWACVLKSGVHATLAGVALALAIPLRPAPGRPDDVKSPLHRLEHAINPWVAYGIVPIFGFANAGVAFGGLSADSLTGPVPLGIALGLFVGKQVGVFGTAWIAIRAGIASMPAGAGWLQLYGTALLCGIGFTMSLFIGGLAFPGMPEMGDPVKVGVFAGSTLSALLGWLVLRFAPRGDGIYRD
ncbi:MAG TPA: Na+/H+ antiporter NhaA [Azospirillaceae bacterium]|nr:Na+/H+ antiporter NhaA [Azospirillaceae bacterium]